MRHKLRGRYECVCGFITDFKDIWKDHLATKENNEWEGDSELRTHN